MKRTAITALALGVMLTMTASVRADTIAEVAADIWSDQYTPLIFEDDNWSLTSQTITYDFGGQIGEVDLEVVTGFVNFTSIFRGDATVPDQNTAGTADIKDVSKTSPSESLANHSELGAWFAGYVFAFETGGDPEENDYNTVYFAPLPGSVTILLDPGDANSGVTWNPTSAGAFFQVYEDTSPSPVFDPDSPTTAYNTLVASGDWVADIGFASLPATDPAEYADGDEYFVNMFLDSKWGNDTADRPDDDAIPDELRGSLNFLSVKAGSLWEKVLPNDTGNDFYVEGGFETTNDADWFVKGDADAKVLLAPLPTAAIPGFLLLGGLFFGLRIRRNKA